MSAEITPVLASVSTDPVSVTGTNGSVYLVYELYLTNATSTPVTIDSVQALDTDSGAVLQARSGADLVAHAKVIGKAPGGTPASSVVLEGGQLAIVWVDPSVATGTALPTALRHQVKVTFASAAEPADSGRTDRGGRHHVGPRSVGPHHQAAAGRQELV